MNEATTAPAAPAQVRPAIQLEVRPIDESTGLAMRALATTTTTMDVPGCPVEVIETEGGWVVLHVPGYGYWRMPPIPLVATRLVWELEAHRAQQRAAREAEQIRTGEGGC